MKKNIAFVIILQLFCWLCISQNNHVIILHTNDTHSQMEPIKTGKEKNTGGWIRLTAAINQIRSENENVLLFDAGDFWQSTSYFNLFQGIPDIEIMKILKYDAVTLGNHQFDLDLDTLAERLKILNTQVLLANFDVSKSPLNGLVKPYTIIEKSGIKFGIIGICIDLQGLVDNGNDKKIIYKDPVPIVNKLAKMLKNKEKCDVVVILSHLGYETYGNIDDVRLAQQSEDIDIIIGGHTHTLPDKAVDVKNKNGKNVIIRQMRKSGIYLGRIDIEK